MGTTVNYANPKTDGTVKIFDEFYSYATSVSQLEYDAVYSYFRSVFNTAQAAGNFTITVFRISESSGIPVMTLLQEFQGQSQPELTLTLAYYLNSLRSNSTLLGLNAATQPNYYVARNVRQ
jgi:pyruvate/2-oxoacid:ferredoxin oxidoreductase alpha subunit